MDRWCGKVAVVTGASSGIGAAIAYQLQDAGVTVVALARRKEKIPEAVEGARREAKQRGRASLGAGAARGQLHCVQCDVQREADIVAAFQWAREHVGAVHILVNNAGVSGRSELTDTNTDEWREILDTNVLGLSICTREAVKLMKEKGVEDGHIVHIGSKAGHTIMPLPGIHMYSASKHAVRVLTEGLRKELVAAKSRIRITEVSPGAVKTDFSRSRQKTATVPGCVEDKVTEEIWNRLSHLKAEDVADVVLYAIATPPHVQIHEIIVNAVGETF